MRAVVLISLAVLRNYIFVFIIIKQLSSTILILGHFHKRNSCQRINHTEAQSYSTISRISYRWSRINARSRACLRNPERNSHCFQLSLAKWIQRGGDTYGKREDLTENEEIKWHEASAHPGTAPMSIRLSLYSIRMFLFLCLLREADGQADGWINGPIGEPLSRLC